MYSINDPRRLAAAFAIAVTAETEVGRGWIARKGAASLFRALEKIFPEVDDHISTDSVPL